MTTQSADYQRGYKAGRKRLEADQAKWDAGLRRITEERVRRRDALFRSALNALVAKGGWSMDGEPCKNMSDYVELARRFADRSLEVLGNGRIHRDRLVRRYLQSVDGVHEGLPRLRQLLCVREHAGAHDGHRLGPR